MEPCSRTLGMDVLVSLSEFELLTSYKKSSYLTVLLVVIGICIPKIEHGSINSNKLLFRFCPTRRIEDQSVAETAVKIWLNLVKVIKYWESLCKSKRPKNSFYETLVLHCKDPLMIAKFHFFSYVAGIFKSHLVSFQTESPMIKINVSDKNIQKEYMETNIGTAATDDLRDKSIKSDIKK